MIVLTKILLFLIAFIKFNECSKILIVNSIKTFSHVAPILELANALTNRGHNVTLISAYPLDDKILSFRKITVNVTTMWDKGGANAKPILAILEVSKLGKIHHFFNFAKQTTECILNDSRVNDLLLNPNEHFDIVIVEQFGTFAVQGFCHHFKADCIIYTPIRFNTIFKPLIGYMPSIFYVQDSLFGYNPNQSFFEEVYNFGVQLCVLFLLHYTYLPKHDELLKRYFKEAPGIYDVMYNTSLVLQNSHISINSPTPEPPNLVDIGGFHIRPDEIVSEEIKEFLDSSKQDVVYFSLGSILKFSQLPNDITNVFLKAFSKLKNVTILCKYDGHNWKEKPDNVKFVSWAPQKYILAHPKVKLFISHGGIFSFMEAVYFGKPVMGIPVFSDQLSNMMYLENIGMGKYIYVKQITADSIVTCVIDILENACFSEKAREKSKIFRDQSMHPLDKAIYWIEYVHRHKGSSLLELKGLHFPVYKRWLLDIFFFIICIICIIVLLFIKCYKFIKY